MWRRSRPADDPPRREVPERWRAVISDCDRLLEELARLVASTQPGPLRDRLEVVRASAGASLDDAVTAARRAGEVERLAGTMDVAGITAAFKRARRDVEAAGRRGTVPEPLVRSLESLRRQHASANRLLNAVDETGGRLEAVRARLTELVLTAGEMALGDQVTGADAQVATLATEVRLLREALGELD